MKRSTNNSKKEIMKAFSSLLDKKVYEDITVNEISKKSFISRTTIYRYFNDKDDIAREYILTTLNKDQPETFEEILKQRLKTLKETNISLYLKDSEEFRRLFFSMKDLNVTKEFESLSETTKAFIAGGVALSIRSWTLNGFNQDIDTLTSDIINHIEKIKK